MERRCWKTRTNWTLINREKMQITETFQPLFRSSLSSDMFYTVKYQRLTHFWSQPQVAIWGIALIGFTSQPRISLLNNSLNINVAEPAFHLTEIFYQSAKLLSLEKLILIQNKLSLSMRSHNLWGLFSWPMKAYITGVPPCAVFPAQTQL